MTFNATLKAGALAAAVGLGATGAFAQAADYSDAKLENFVTAALEVSEVGMQAQQDIQAAETDEQRREIATEAQTEAQTIIEGADGITVDEYVEIGSQLETNQELAQRINALVAERAQP